MTPSAVRWGGIMVFIGIALVFIIPIGFMSVVGIQGLAGGAGGGAQTQLMSIVLNIVITAVIVFVFLATKGYFNALGYHNADVVIYVFVGTQIISAVINMLANTSAGLGGLFQMAGIRGLGVLGIIAIVVGIAVLVALLIFAIFCISFGKLGGGVWTAIGVLYLIGLIGMLIALIVVLASTGLALGGGSTGGSGPFIAAVALLVVGFLCYAAAIICHGIGLILGAGRMEREANPADVFD